jgi:hypothetical protein
MSEVATEVEAKEEPVVEPVVSKEIVAEPTLPPMGRIVRAQSAYRWLLPQLAAMTPQYIESVLRGALAGNHVQQWELFDLMLDTWPELSACVQELTAGVARMKVIYEPFAEEDETATDGAIERCKLVSAAMRRMAPNGAADENGLEGTIEDLVDGWFRGVTPVKAGGGEPVTVVFSEAVPAVSVLELALSPNSSEPEVLAYLDVFAQENATTYTGVLDTNDARLIAHLVGKQSQVLSAEVVVTWPGQARRVFPNFTVTVQPPVITGPTSSEGGPVWVSETTLAAALAATNLSGLPTSDPGGEKIWIRDGGTYLGGRRKARGSGGRDRPARAHRLAGQRRRHRAGGGRASGAGRGICDGRGDIGGKWPLYGGRIARFASDLFAFRRGVSHPIRHVGQLEVGAGSGFRDHVSGYLLERHPHAS